MKSENFEFSLSPSNIISIPFQKYQQDFTFIVNGKKHCTSRFIADILSPKVSKLHFIDESINEFSITIQNESDQEDHFDNFLNLINFDNVTLTENQKKHFMSYFLLLGNINEYVRLQHDYFQTLSTTNAIDRLLFIQNYLKDEPLLESQVNFKDQIISFISGHFEEMNKDEMNKINPETLDEIMKNKELKINDEDSLLNFIINMYLKDPTTSFLFENVDFTNVSVKELEKFIQIFSMNDLYEGTWRSICRRLLDIKSEKHSYNVNIIELMKKKGQEFDGIMRYLSKESGGNIHDNGTVEITTNSIYDNNPNSYHPKHLVDYNNNNRYDSDNVSGVFVCFDFKKNRIQLSSYSIKSYDGSQNGCHLRNWVIEVSNDGNTWTEVDCHSNDSTLNHANAIGTFKISKESNDFYRFVRLRQTGISWYNNYLIYLCFIEFYGKLQLI